MTTRSLTLFLLFVAARFLFAQAGGTAVVVGIADFEDPGITDLEFTARDAAVFADYLRRPSGGDLAAGRVRVLLDSAATLAAIQSALAWQLETASPDAPSYLYLATHGDVEAEQVNTGGFLLAHDTPRNNYELLALSVGFLNDHITRLAAKGVTVIVVTDACHAGTLAGDAVAGRTLTAARLMQRLDSEVRLLSCQPYELAREGRQWGDGRGAFSYHLIRGLEGAADADRDRRIDLFELEQYVGESVSEDTERQQHPALVGGRKDWSISTVSLEGERGALAERSVEVAEDFLSSQLALASPGIQRTYLRFRRAVAAGNLTTPAERSAQDYFWQLRGEPALLPLRGLLDEAYTVPLLDSVQQAIQDYLEADADELMRREELDEKYLAFPEFLAEAARTLGPQDPRYPGIEAKRRYFAGLILRLRTNFTLQTDSLLAAAREQLERAVELAPAAAYIRNELGIVREAQGEYEAARAAYERARELAPTWALPHNNLGKLLIAMDPEGKVDSAALLYARAIELRPDLATAYMNYGNLMSVTGRKDTAVILLREAIRIAPNFAAVRYNLANVLVDRPESRAEAVELYRWVMAARPEFVQAHFGLGYAYEEAGLLDSAAAVYRQLLRISNTGLERYVYNGLNRIYLETDPREGLAFFSQVMTDAPELPYGYAHTAALDTTDRKWMRALSQVSLPDTAHFDLITSVAVELYGLQDLPRAVEAARLGSRLHSGMVAAHRVLTDILLLSDRTKEAGIAARRAVSVARKVDELEDLCAYVLESDLYEPLLATSAIKELYDRNCPTEN